MGFADLHIHIKDQLTNKNGEDIESVLNDAIQNKVYTLAFTSHNTLEQYVELFKTLKKIEKTNSELYNQVINNMNFSIGCEIDSRIEDGDAEYARHMLVYNIPIEKMKDFQEWLNNNTNKDLKAGFQLAQLKHFKSTADRLDIPYEKDRMLSQDTQYAGLVFAKAVKDKVDNMLSDVLIKDSPISHIFSNHVLNDENAKLIMEKYASKKEAYLEILNNEEIVKNNPDINLIKHLYYQIIDLRLFASKNVNEDSMETMGKQVKDMLNAIVQELRNERKIELDEECKDLIIAELYSKLFNPNKDNERTSDYDYGDIPDNPNYQKYKLALYYSIAKEISAQIKSDKGLKKDFKDIQNALIQSSINFADVINRLGWFNSELVRPGTTPFSFSSVGFKPKLEDVISEVHSLGGIIEVAHPFAIESEENIQQYMQTCFEKGVDGMEALYVSSSDKERCSKQTEIIREFCQDHNLIYAHGGTDFHFKGTDKIGILKTGDRIEESEITDKIKVIPARQFMEKMKIIMPEKNDEELDL